MEAERCFARFIKRHPVNPGGFQQGVSAYDVSLDEFGRPGNRSVHVRLGSQVHYGIRLVLKEHAIQVDTVADVNVLESVARVLIDRLQGLEVACVGQFINVDN